MPLSVHSLELVDATVRLSSDSGSSADSSAADQARWTQSHASLRVAGAEILYVHLPAEKDAPELMRARLRALDQGRQQFRKRVRKQPKPKPVERFTPLTSDRVVEAHDDV